MHSEARHIAGTSMSMGPQGGAVGGLKNSELCAVSLWLHWYGYILPERYIGYNNGEGRAVARLWLMDTRFPTW